MNAPATIGNNGIPGPNVNIIPGAHATAFVDALMRQVLDQLPLVHAARLSAQLLNQVRDVVRNHILALAGTLFSTAGLTVLLPSLTVVIVNALGFTSGGVLAGSAAALIQSQLYGAFTSGLFSVVQSFGATAAVASPGVLVVGGVLLGAGVGFFKLWKWYHSRALDPLLP